MPRLPDAIPDSILRILLTTGIGPVTYAKLRDRLGDDDAITRASVADLKHIPGIGDITAPAIRASLDAADPAAERSAMSQFGASLILHSDSDYPALLRMIPDAPLALWVRGSIMPNDALALAVVGSRSCTAYGREQTSRLCGLLAEAGLTIVSGGATGIDTEAHRAAVRVNGRTIVVLGCGVGVDYPRENSDLFTQIVGDSASTSPTGYGAVISEFPTNTPPRPELFPRRNRIISGLSLGVLVIEAGIRSGSLITARLAAEDHQREVMALPGRVDSPASAGCLRAIRDGWAALVTDHADVLHALDSSRQLLRGVAESLQTQGRNGDKQPAEAPVPKPSTAPTLFDVNLTSAQHAIVEVMQKCPDEIVPPDFIAAHTQLPMNQILADLTLLEIRRHVKRKGAGYQLILRSQ